MEIKLKDCIKGFDREISKVIPPEQTCRIVLAKLRKIDPPLLKTYYEVRRPSKIPQYRITGTDYFQEFSQESGTNGKGHTHEQALASGLMEFVERYSCFKFLSNNSSFKVAALKELRNKPFRIKDFYSNPEDEYASELFAKGGFKDIKARWYAGATLDGRRIYLPSTIIKAYANGCAAGNTVEEALLHAICEIVERHCLTLIELNELETPLIDISTVKYPEAKKLIDLFFSLGHKLLIRDFSIGIGLPIIGLVRQINENDCIVTCGVASHPEEALIRALTESSQGEGNTDATKRIVSCRKYFSERKTTSMNDIPNIGDKNIKIELQRISNILGRQDMKIYFLNATDAKLGIPSVIVFISKAKYYRKAYAFRSIFMILIEEFFATQDYEAVEKYIKLARAADKKNSLIYLYYQGRLQMTRKAYQEAADCFSSVSDKIEINEFKGRSLVNLCLCYLALKKISNAVNCYVKIINSYSRNNFFGSYSFEAFYFNKLIAESIKKCRFDVSRLFAGEVLNIVKINPQLLKLEKIKFIFLRYERRRRKFYRIFQMACEHFKLAQYEIAIREIKECIALAPGEIDSYFILSSCYEQTKRFRMALLVYNKFLKLFPYNGTVYFGLGSLHFRQDNYLNAIVNADKAIKLGFAEVDAYLLLAISYEKLGQYEKAVRFLKEAKKIDPLDHRLNFCIFNCYRKIANLGYSL